MKDKEKILVSACLVGESCRYDGKSKRNNTVLEYLKDKEVYLVCPERDAGLPTPRTPSEITNGKVINKDGKDMTVFYELGAKEALEICKENNIKKALLKAKSPSCGKGKVYDGNFSGKLINGNGITTELLTNNGIEVITEEEI